MGLASVKEDEYFAHVVSEDLMAIIRDIREAHKRDITTADEPSGSAIFLQRLNDYTYESRSKHRQSIEYFSS